MNEIPKLEETKIQVFAGRSIPNYLSNLHASTEAWQQCEW